MYSEDVPSSTVGKARIWDIAFFGNNCLQKLIFSSRNSSTSYLRVLRFLPVRRVPSAHLFPKSVLRLPAITNGIAYIRIDRHPCQIFSDNSPLIYLLGYNPTEHNNEQSSIINRSFILFWINIIYERFWV